MPLSDDVLLETERRARAALRGDPPTLTAAEAPHRFDLEARPEVVEFIRDVGPPLVLRLVEEVRRLRAEQAKLIERLRSVETWNTRA